MDKTRQENEIYVVSVDVDDPTELQWFIREAGEAAGETLVADNTIISKTAINHATHDLLLTITGKGYSYERCRQLVRNMDFLGDYRGNDWTVTTSLHHSLEQHITSVQEKRLAALQTARSRWQAK